MEIRILSYFLAVAREESVTRAAEILHITQPTLSRQLTQLEEETGTKLFHRGSRKIRLTDEGMLLRRRAEEIIALVDKTSQELLIQNEQIAMRPLSPELSATTVLAWRRNQPFGKAAEKFIEHIKCFLSMSEP